MASAGLCFSLSLAPCENQIVLCLKRRGEKGFAYTPIFGKCGCVLKRKKKSFQWLDFECYCWRGKLLEGMRKKISAEWSMLNFFFWAALNPIRSLIRVMHRGLHAAGRFLLGAFRRGLKLERAWLRAGLFNVWWGVLCPGESLKPSGEHRWSFPLFRRRGREIIWHCG